MKNLENLVMTLALVKEEKRAGKWDQETWTRGLEDDPETGFKKVTCGTTACVAGWAVITKGGVFINDEDVLALDTEIADPDIYTPERWVEVPDQDGSVSVKTVSVERRATRLLGLDEDEAHYLFDGDNNFKTVKRLLKQYIKEARKERRELAEEHA